MIGHAAGIGARRLRDVAHRHGVEAIGGEQLFRRGEDRLAHVRLAGRFLAGGLACHVICTIVQKIRSRQQRTWVAARGWDTAARTHRMPTGVLKNAGFQQDGSAGSCWVPACCWPPPRAHAHNYPEQTGPYPACPTPPAVQSTCSRAPSGQALAKTWGQQPVIDNRPGAGGIIASQALTQAAPDGYTLILVASGHPLNQFIYPSVPYDTFKDFTAITEVASSPLAIVVAKDSPLQDFRRSPGGGEEGAGQAVLRHVRQRHLGAPRRRAAQTHGRRQDRRHPVQGRRTGADRRHRRRDPDEPQSTRRGDRPAGRRSRCARSR